MPKEYKTKAELLEYLKKVKGIDPDTIIDKTLDEEAYANLITPYSDLVCKDKDINTKRHRYYGNTNFEIYIKCKKFDESLSERFHLIIGTFEKSLKVFLSFCIGEKLKSIDDIEGKSTSWINDYLEGKPVFDFVELDKELRKDDGETQLLPENCDTLSRRKEALLEVKSLIEGKSGDKSALVKHYINSYGYVPYHIAILRLSLGKLLAIFTILSYEDKNLFIRQYLNGKSGKNYTINKIQKCERDFARLTTIRNIVNHYDTLVAFLLRNSENYEKNFEDLIRQLVLNYKSSILTSDNILLLKKPDFIIQNDYNRKYITLLNKVVELFES